MKRRAKSSVASPTPTSNAVSGQVRSLAELTPVPAASTVASALPPRDSPIAPTSGAPAESGQALEPPGHPDASGPPPRGDKGQRSLVPALGPEEAFAPPPLSSTRSPHQPLGVDSVGNVSQADAVRAAVDTSHEETFSSALRRREAGLETPAFAEGATCFRPSKPGHLCPCRATCEYFGLVSKKLWREARLGVARRCQEEPGGDAHVLVPVAWQSAKYSCAAVCDCAIAPRAGKAGSWEGVQLDVASPDQRRQSSGFLGGIQWFARIPCGLSGQVAATAPIPSANDEPRSLIRRCQLRPLDGAATRWEALVHLLATSSWALDEFAIPALSREVRAALWIGAVSREAPGPVVRIRQDGPSRT
ncbi:hypothetical protein Emed_007038 [Eimeria media]